MSAAIRGFHAPANLAELTERCLRLYDKLALEDPQSYVITEEDNADFAVQHYVLPQGCRPEEGVTFDLRYVGDPTVDPQKPAKLAFTIRNNTAWRWNMRLSLRLPEGLTASGEGALDLKPGESAVYEMTVSAADGVEIPDTRAYPCGLIVRRLNCGSAWTDYRIPFTLLAPNRWTLNGVETLIPACTVRFPEVSGDGVYTAEAVLTTSETRDTRLICNTEYPVTVTVDGQERIVCQTGQPFLPAYHRAPAAQIWDGRLDAGKHEVRVVVRTPVGDAAPRFVITLNAPAAVAEPGNFYAYTDDHFAR